MRRWAAPSLAALVCPALVALCYAVVDRPAAMLAHESFADYRPVFDLLTHLVDPVPPLATLGIVGAGVASLLGWQPGPGGRVLVACCLATLVAVVLKDQLEFVFGRLRPETRVRATRP